MDKQRTPCEVIGSATKVAVREVMVSYKLVVECMKRWYSKLSESCTRCVKETSAELSDIIEENETEEETELVAEQPEAPEKKTKTAAEPPVKTEEIKKEAKAAETTAADQQKAPEEKKEDWSENKKYTFKYSNPEAKKVEIAGDFSNWKKKPMDKKKDGFWRVTLELAPGKHAYKYIVDGEWIKDPKNPKTQPDSFGGKSSIFEIV